jgi:hypothetical protein
MHHLTNPKQKVKAGNWMMEELQKKGVTSNNLGQAGTNAKRLNANGHPSAMHLQYGPSWSQTFSGSGGVDILRTAGSFEVAECRWRQQRPRALTKLVVFSGGCW